MIKWRWFKRRSPPLWAPAVHHTCFAVEQVSVDVLERFWMCTAPYDVILSNRCIIVSRTWYYSLLISPFTQIAAVSYVRTKNT